MDRIQELQEVLERNKEHKRTLAEADRQLLAEQSVTMTKGEARLYLMTAHAELVYGEELIEELIGVYRENESLKRKLREAQGGREEKYEIQE